MKVAGQRITKRDILVLFIFGMVFQAMLQFVLPAIDDRDSKQASEKQEKSSPRNHPKPKPKEKPLELPRGPVDKWEELHMANILGVPQDYEDMRVQRKSKKRKTVLDEEGENEDDSVFERGGHMFKFQPVVPIKVERKNKRRRSEFIPVAHGGVGGRNYPEQKLKRTENKQFDGRKEFGDMEYQGDDYINPEESKRNVKRYQQQRTDDLVRNEGGHKFNLNDRQVPKKKEVRNNLQAPKDRRMGKDIESPLQRNMRVKESGPLGVNGKKYKEQQLEINRAQMFAGKSKKEPAFGKPLENFGELHPFGDHVPKQKIQPRLSDVLKQSHDKNKNKIDVPKFDRNLLKGPEYVTEKPDPVEREQSHILEKLRQAPARRVGRFEKPNLDAAVPHGFGGIRSNVFKEVIENPNFDGRNHDAATQTGFGGIGSRNNPFREALGGKQSQLNNNLRFREPELRKEDSPKKRHFDRGNLEQKWMDNGPRRNQPNLMNQERLERKDPHRKRVQRDLEFQNDGQAPSKDHIDQKFEQNRRDGLSIAKDDFDKINNKEQHVHDPGKDDTTSSQIDQYLLEFQSRYMRRLREENCTGIETETPLDRSRDIQMDIIAMKRIPFMDDITLSTQLRAEQLKQLLLILKSWEGPVSAAIYIDRLESQTFVNYLRNNLVLRTRTNLDIHIVKSRGDGYPTNFLRKVALGGVRTGYTFMVDVDFIPQAGMYNIIKQHINQGRPSTKEMLIVPAFEVFRNTTVYPQTKNALLQQWRNADLLPYNFQFFPPSHLPTRYDLWIDASSLYSVEYYQGFEPYFVAKIKEIPKIQDTVLAKFKNKSAHTYMYLMHQLGFRFTVIPDTYVVHIPHPDVPDDTSFKKCASMVRKLYQKSSLGKEMKKITRSKLERILEQRIKT